MEIHTILLFLHDIYIPYLDFNPHESYRLVKPTHHMLHMLVLNSYYYMFYIPHFIVWRLWYINTRYSNLISWYAKSLERSHVCMGVFLCTYIIIWTAWIIDQFAVTRLRRKAQPDNSILLYITWRMHHIVNPTRALLNSKISPLGFCH
jgi:hypothetical protein